MKIYLNVPFSEKDFAKKHGAKWDGAIKMWYVTDSVPTELVKYKEEEKPLSEMTETEARLAMLRAKARGETQNTQNFTQKEPVTFSFAGVKVTSR